jgi:hypothetical protein
MLTKSIGTDGNFYGTTNGGFYCQYGSIFNLTTDLGPFVETPLTFGSVRQRLSFSETNSPGQLK